MPGQFLIPDIQVEQINETTVRITSTAMRCEFYVKPQNVITEIEHLLLEYQELLLA
jgi:hypothetical protein